MLLTISLVCWEKLPKKKKFAFYDYLKKTVCILWFTQSLNWIMQFIDLNRITWLNVAVSKWPQKFMFSNALHTLFSFEKYTWKRALGIRTQSWATNSRWPCLNRGVGPNDLQRSLLTPTILWTYSLKSGVFWICTQPVTTQTAFQFLFCTSRKLSSYQSCTQILVLKLKSWPCKWVFVTFNLLQPLTSNLTLNVLHS